MTTPEQPYPPGMNEPEWAEGHSREEVIKRLETTIPQAREFARLWLEVAAKDEAALARLRAEQQEWHKYREMRDAWAERADLAEAQVARLDDLVRCAASDMEWILQNPDRITDEEWKGHDWPTVYRDLVDQPSEGWVVSTHDQAQTDSSP